MLHVDDIKRHVFNSAHIRYHYRSKDFSNFGVVFSLSISLYTALQFVSLIKTCQHVNIKNLYVDVITCNAGPTFCRYNRKYKKKLSLLCALVDYSTGII